MRRLLSYALLTTVAGLAIGVVLVILWEVSCR